MHMNDVFDSSCVHFLVPPDDAAFLRVAHDLYMLHGKFPEAISLAIRLGDPKMIRKDFDASGNPFVAFYASQFI